jgi:uncharacterized phage protein (TIGR02218 family)
MSKEISAELKAHLAQEVTTIATCLKLTRQDNAEYFFTDHDADIIYDGDTYEATDGILPMSLNQTHNLAVDNMEIIAALGVNEVDIGSGLFDFAEVDIFIINYEDVGMGVMYLAKGWSIGAVEINDNTYQAELRGKTQLLQNNICETYTPECRAILGDARCGIDLDDSAGDNWCESSVTSVPGSSRVQFLCNTFPSKFSTNDFRYGKLTWLEPGSGDSYNGNNAGFESEVKANSTFAVQLLEPVLYDINIGDEFRIEMGCDKDIETCKAKFNNVVNFRGEPFIPGWDKVMDIAVR